MVYHLVLCSLRPGITPDEIEEMMRRTRMSLLKIDVALTVRCGHLTGEGSGAINARALDGPAPDERLGPDRDLRETDTDPWEFFVAIEVNSIERLAVYREHPIYIKYMEEVLKPQTRRRLVLNFEMDPRAPRGRLRTASPGSPAEHG